MRRYVVPWTNLGINGARSVRWPPRRLPRPSLPRNMIKRFGFTSKQQNPFFISADPVHNQIKLNSSGKAVQQRLSTELKESRNSLRNLVTVHQASSHHHCVWPQSPSTISHLVSTLKCLYFRVLSFSRGTVVRFEERRQCQWVQLSYVGWFYSNLVYFTLYVSFLVDFKRFHLHHGTSVTQIVNQNSHQTKKRIPASGNDQIKGWISLWTYWTNESRQKILYNTSLPIVLFVHQFLFALNIPEDLDPL